MFDPDDEALWTRARNGDERAFAAIFDRHHRRVFRHTVQLLQSPSDADEVMAAAFLELWRRRAVVRIVEGSVLPWLLVTATNLCRNRLRGLVRYRVLLARLPRERADDPEELGMTRIRRSEQRRDILHALRQLSTIDATLVVLTALDGLSSAAAGEAVGISAGAARVRLSRARGRLRDLLSPLEAEPGHDLLEGSPR